MPRPVVVGTNGCEVGTARTDRGPVRGTAMAGGWAFRGLPYAAPPVGTLRFRPPRPPERWDGIRDCADWGPPCPQPHTLVPLYQAPYEIPPHWKSVSTVLGPPADEDCLSLNVFTPAADDGRRPTMVWVHGGGFRCGGSGSPIYGNGAFLPDDVVLVTFNYRLNLFGSLYLDEDFDGAEDTGNLANLDQVAALEWVRSNIAAFGGDPDNVTVFGQSAGGSYVTMLLAMPRARGLFRRAIVQSAGQAMVTPEEARGLTRTVLSRIGVTAGDWEGLREVPSERLMTLLDSGEIPLDAQGRVPLLPVVGGAVLPLAPIDAVARGGAGGVSVVIGSTRDEWFGFWTGAPAGSIAPRDVAGTFSALGRSAEEGRQHYALRGATSEEAFMAAFDTDRLFRVPTMRVAEGLAAAGSEVRCYRLDWAPALPTGSAGAFHGLDLPLVFGALDDPATVGQDPPGQLSAAMHGAWVSFARHGVPQVDGVGEWPRYERPGRSTVLFDVASRVAQDPDRETRRLWAVEEVA